MENQSRTLLTIVGIAVVVILGGVIWYMNADRDEGPEFTDTTSNPAVAGATQNANLIVYQPQAKERIGTPLIVEGEARVFENTVNFRLRDAAGKELAVGFATADSKDVGQFGDFRGELNFISETDQQGTLEVFWLSPQDGSEIDKLTIPVTITKTAEFIKG
jgi:hypothetical protein